MLREFSVLKSTSTLSKSMLRAVVHKFASGYANVDYFPNYEMVIYSPIDESWVWDRRNVRRALVRHMTDTFRQHCVKES